MDIAAIIGNGTSRVGYDLRKFEVARVPVWGCNALYREYNPAAFDLPNYLVMVDDGIMREVNKSVFPKDRLVVPPYDERWEPKEANEYRPRMNAGMAAMKEAIKRGNKFLICLGFDFLIVEAAQSISNIYDGTLNYGPDTRANEHDNANRIKFLCWFMKQHKDVLFQFVYPSNTIVHTLFEANVRWASYPQLDDQLLKLQSA